MAQLYQEYLGGGGVSQQKIFGSSLEEIRTNAIKAGINPVNLQQAQQFQDGSWTPFASGTSATYKGSEGIAEQSFVGTNQEITQQATAAGINPSNLFTGLDKFVPEADDNIDISQGSSSLLQGSQSRWFEIFQNSYTAGQDTIQQGIVDLQKQQADITQRARDTYQANIDKAQTGIDELEEETHGRELKEELSEEYEIKEKIDRLGELGRQMAQLQGAYDSSVSETEMSGITIGQSRGELARKQRKYAERASLIQIESAMITNQVNLAKDIIQNTYNDITEERDKELSRYEKLLDVASKAHLALDDDDKNQITTQINLLLGEQAKQEANKDKIMALAIDPNTTEAFFSSGASLDDTYEQILEKMSPFMSAFARAERLDVGDGTGTDVATGYSGSVIDLLQEAIDLNATPEAAARSAAAILEGMGIQTDVEMLNDWAEQARKLTKTFIPPEFPTPLAPIAPAKPTVSKKAGASVAKELVTPIKETRELGYKYIGKPVRDYVGGFWSELFGSNN